MVEPNPASLERAGSLSVPERKLAPWPRRLAAVVVVLLALAAGAVLSLYPWLPEWESNFFADLIPFWSNSYVRGGVTGLGVITLAIAVVEMFRLGRR